MTRHFVSAAVGWAALTAVGVWLSLGIDLFPVAAAREAHITDDAFRLLLILSVPVFTLVLVVLLYSLWRFRSRDGATDAPPLPEPRAVAIAWVFVTSVLSVAVIFTPGLTGLNELGWFSPPDTDFVVKVEAQQWDWSFTFPQYGVTLAKTRELPLPIGRRVRFEITSTDVIHSFWIPAFRMKIDAVPGLVTGFTVTPDRLGSFAETSAYRVQCAQICGTGHSRMSVRLSVLSAADFDARMAKARALAEVK